MLVEHDVFPNPCPGEGGIEELKCEEKMQVLNVVVTACF
jgi:hypothetical protein